VYYGFDPENPNARFSAPNKLFEALAAGRPLITGNFGEIAEVVGQSCCGIILPEYTSEAIAEAFGVLRWLPVRSGLAQNAAEAGRNTFNWEHAEATLYREYSTLLPSSAGVLCDAAAGTQNVSRAGAR
jgi:glycosyltransferase involved in cell wall biosynthesis